MIIREYIPKDRTQIMRLMIEFGSYLTPIDPMSRVSFAKDGEVYFTDKLLHEVETKNGKVFVAEDNDKVIGFIGGYIEEQSKEELMESKPAKPGVISEFFVTQTHRKGGIGSKLIATMEEYLKQQGCSFVRLEVFGPNIQAREFYSKRGYQERSVIVSKDL